MQYTNPRYMEDGTIQIGDGVFIPIDEANSDYQEIMRQVDAGTLVIAPYVEPV